MLDLNPETVCFIIERAREFQSQDAVVMPEGAFGPNDDWAMEVLAEHSEDLTLQEAKAGIDDLEPDQQIALVALMWVGRGDFESGEWEDAVREAQLSYNARTADYLLATPMVSDYLEEGLAQLGYECE